MFIALLKCSRTLIYSTFYTLFSEYCCVSKRGIHKPLSVSLGKTSGSTNCEKYRNQASSKHLTVPKRFHVVILLLLIL